MFKANKKHGGKIELGVQEPDEQIRMICTNMQQMKNDSISIIMVMSPEENQDQSCISSSLGAAFAETGKKVLLVDAHVHTPLLHELFFLKNKTGFIETINGSQPNIYPTKNLGLHVLTAGSTAAFSREMWTAANVKRAAADLKAAFDIVIFNAPPFLETADAQILSSVCSDIVLVITENKTKKQHLAKTKALLERTGKKLTGAIYQMG